MAATATKTAKLMSTAPGARLTEVANELAAHAAAVRTRDAQRIANAAEAARLQAELEAAQKAFDIWNAPAARLARARQALFDSGLACGRNDNAGDSRVRQVMPSRIRRALERVEAEFTAVRMADDPLTTVPAERAAHWAALHARNDLITAARAKLNELASREWNSDRELQAAVKAVLATLDDQD